MSTIDPADPAIQASSSDKENNSSQRTNISIPKASSIKPETIPIKPLVRKVVKPTPPLDPDFICPNAFYRQHEQALQSEIEKTSSFNTQLFLTGSKPFKKHFKPIEHNEELLQNSKLFLKSILPKGNPELACKQCIGLLDEYDAQHPQKSSFVLRIALLLISTEKGVKIDSWMVFTKKGKPSQRHIWPFVENWKNWIPEVQGVFAKYCEKTIVKAQKLASEQSAQKAILLKGGFGAGKTRLTKELVSDPTTVLSPDDGKQTLRRSIPEATHAQAHIQGSQIAFALFNEAIDKISGSVYYDSSLSNPNDIRSYLKKAKKAGKKLTIFDVARNDSARMLSVLSRKIGGQDPRIPPQVVFQSALWGKLSRLDCMKVILEQPSASSDAEYHFTCSNEKGVDTQKILTLRTGNSITISNALLLKRLNQEGLKLTHDTDGKLLLSSSLTKEELEETLKTEMEKTTSLLLASLDPAIQQELSELFSKRSFHLSTTKEITTPEALYEAFPAKVKNALPKQAFIDSFKGISEESKKHFFDIVHSKQTLSYLDFPLWTALSIHSQLTEDPWI